MPGKSAGSFLWYKFIQERVWEFLKSGGLCPKRLIVAGYLPLDIESSRFQDFLEQMQLKDSAIGACEIGTACNTLATVNELFVATLNNEEPSRVDRILVNRDAYIYSSSRS